MFIIAVILVFFLVVTIYCISIRKQKPATTIKPREQINEFYKSVEGEFKVAGYKDEFTVTKDENIGYELENQGLMIFRYWNGIPKHFEEYDFYKFLVPIPIC